MAGRHMKDDGKKNVGSHGGIVLLIVLILLLAGIFAALYFRPFDFIPEVFGRATETVEATEADGQTQTEAPQPTEEPTEAPTEGPAAPASYMMEHSEVIPQVEFKAGCETYACTMLLQTLGFDMDEHLFLDKYLDIHWVYYGDDGNRYGPDMYSSQAGDIYGGWGVYAPAMAKYMNNYLSDVKSDKKATALEGVPLQELCEKYVANDIPVMVWATTWMMEPYEKDSWIVDYVDENAKTKIGDTFTWLQNEHCMVLVGYNEENYYFMDSCAMKVSEFDRETSELRYSQLGSQAIVVD